MPFCLEFFREKPMSAGSEMRH